MPSKYRILYMPLAFNLVDNLGKFSTPLDILSFLANRDSGELSEDNYRDFLRFDLTKRRMMMDESMALQSNTMDYVANQIAKQDGRARVILADGRRRTLEEIIEAEGKPQAVFITAVSCNFPTAVAATIALNHARIPVVLGGIHVSTSRNDIDNFIRPHVPHPSLVSQVIGAGDSETISQILSDLNRGSLRSEYAGHTVIEDGVWGSNNVEQMEPLRPWSLARKFPPIGGFLAKRARLTSIAPYMGCPYSCVFCSISSMPREQRTLTTRSPQDFVAELKEYQKDGVSFDNRLFFFLPDNLLLTGEKLEEILDQIIGSDLRINYMAQVSIEVTKKDDLLKKLRASGATHFQIGLESLDLENLEIVGKNIVGDIRKSGLSVRDYYSQGIKKIQGHGISVCGSFIFGLPNDYFHSLSDHSGIDVARFCTENHISMEPHCLTDLPGSALFDESQRNNTCLYGKQGTMDYLLALSVADITEGNRVPPPSLRRSPLLAAYLAFDASRKVGTVPNSIRNALTMAFKAWAHPTRNGYRDFRERVNDSASAALFQMVTSLYKEHGERLAISTKEYSGAMKRLYDLEQSQEIRDIFKGSEKLSGWLLHDGGT